MNSIRVLIVDDHEIVREGLRTLLAEEQDIRVAGEAAEGAQAIQAAHQVQPDVILMDLLMPGVDGLQATREILRANPNARVLVLTTFADDARVREAIQSGAIGYLLKDVLKSDLLRAIRAAAQGKPTLHPHVQESLMRQTNAPLAAAPHSKLSERERQVLRLIARGKSNKEIARELKLTEGTVKGYVSAIFDILGVEDRTQAALYAIKQGLEN